MTADGDAHHVVAGRRITTGAMAGRLGRSIVATLVVGGYLAVGFTFALSAEGYLLVGIPITVGFQVLLRRRPLRALWLEAMPPVAFSRRSAVAVAVVAIAPAIVALRGVQHQDPVLAAYGLAGMAGAVGAVYSIRAMDHPAVMATVRATLMNSAILVTVMVFYRVATAGFGGDVREAAITAVLSVATYLPVVFVMEEVFFRGLLDPYLHGATPGADRATAIYGSALWGLWHLPVVSVSLGLLTIPYLIAIHSALGYGLIQGWRRTGNLGVPGIAHAVSDALRNAVAVL